MERLGKDAPDVSPEQMAAVVLQAMPDGKRHGRLLRYLLGNPDALTTGRSDMPPGVMRIADALIGLGVRNVRRPHCVVCNSSEALPYKRGDGRMCRTCHSRYGNDEECSICHRIQRVNTRDDRGEPLCALCSRRLKLEQCSVCAALDMVAARIEGEPVCQLCYDRPKRKCSVCDELRPVHSKKTGADVCRDCYRKGNNPSSESTTRHRPTRRRKCIECSQVRLCVNFLGNAPLCVPCAGRPLAPCAYCSRQRPVQAYVDGAPVCNTCYKRTQPPGLCKSCGDAVHLYESGVCEHCVLRQRVSQLLASQSGEIPECLLAVSEALVIDRNPRPVLRWLQQSEGAALLRRIALGYDDISHETIDRQPPSLSVEFVRSILVFAGALPPVGNQRRLDTWLESFLAEQPKEHVFLIGTYARWRVFRSLRKKLETDKISEAGLKWAKLRIRTAAAFLSWLGSRGLDLARCTQSDVERWLTDSRVVTVYSIRDFLRWTNSRAFTEGLQVPARPRSTAIDAIDDEARWNDIERLLTDKSIRAGLRLIGLLALVFGQHVSRVCTLTVEHIIEDAGVLSVTFGTDPVKMPPCLAEVLSSQSHEAAANPKARRPDGKRWLFPGQQFGNHVTANAVVRALIRIGVKSRPARNAALMSLAAELEAGIVASAFGLHINTAVLWSVNAGRAFNRHIARRTSDRSDSGQAKRDTGSPHGSRPSRRRA